MRFKIVIYTSKMFLYENSAVEIIIAMLETSNFLPQYGSMSLRYHTTLFKPLSQ